MGRVLNPIVSESYMKGYIKDEGLIKPEGKITITENGTDIDVAQFRTADVAVSGGGGISNPVIEVTFINNTGTSIGPLLFVFDENDNEMKWVQFNFANGATEVVNTVVIPSSFDGPEGPFSYFEDVYLYDTTITASDAVNCTFGEERIRVTDPTQNGSITLTLS